MELEADKHRHHVQRQQTHKDITLMPEHVGSAIRQLELHRSVCVSVCVCFTYQLDLVSVHTCSLSVSHTCLTLLPKTWTSILCSHFTSSQVCTALLIRTLCWLRIIVDCRTETLSLTSTMTASCLTLTRTSEMVFSGFCPDKVSDSVGKGPKEVEMRARTHTHTHCIHNAGQLDPTYQQMMCT